MKDNTEHITGTEVAYYFVCARKLWFFAHNIQCEQESDAVRMGRHIHETSYRREKKEISIDGVIVVDWIDHDKKVIHEVKKSASMEKAHTWQLKYYMWYLEQKVVYSLCYALRRVPFNSTLEELKSLTFSESGSRIADRCFYYQ